MCQEWRFNVCWCRVDHKRGPVFKWLNGFNKDLSVIIDPIKTNWRCDTDWKIVLIKEIGALV